MTAWHRTWRADLGLRAAGLACWTAAYAAIVLLIARHTLDQSAGTVALAAAAFLGGCTGGALLTLGRHLFDEIEVSQRWHSHGRPRDISPSPAVRPMMDRPEPESLIVSMEPDGSWTVRGGGGQVVRRFATGQQAQRFARIAGKVRPAASSATSIMGPSRIEGRLSLRTLSLPVMRLSNA